jgi:hypothetical protein
MKLPMRSPLNLSFWLCVLGGGLILSGVHAQNAPAPTQTPAPAQAPPPAAGTTAIPAARPAPGNNAAPQAKPPTAATAPATTAPKTAEPAKTPPPPAKKPDAKAATAPPPPAPATTPDKAAADASNAPAPEDTPKKKAGAEPPPCIVADFRAIGIDTQDTEKRRALALAWIKQRGKQCSAQQLLVMRNNRSQWLGNADSGAAAAAIDSLLEVFAETNPDIALLLYGTPPPPPPPPDPKAKKPPGK